MITAAVALCGVAIQYVKSDSDYKLSEIKRQQSELKTAEAENLRQHLLNQVKQTENDLSQLQVQRDKASNELGSLMKNLKELHDKLSPATQSTAIQEASQ